MMMKPYRMWVGEREVNGLVVKEVLLLQLSVSFQLRTHGISSIRMTWLHIKTAFLTTTPTYIQIPH